MRCLCFPCIIYYLGGYVYPVHENQVYPQLIKKGFTAEEQSAIAEEWYWIAIERETAVLDYLKGYITFTDGCCWRPPPPMRPVSIPPSSASAATLASLAHPAKSSRVAAVIPIIPMPPPTNTFAVPKGSPDTRPSSSASRSLGSPRAL